MAVTAGSASTGRNWRRIFFYVVEVTFAIIAATGEGFMYAAYSPNGPERWPEAIARAAITQIIIVMFGVAAIEAWRIRSGVARIFFTLVIWIVTIGAGSLTFWFLWEAAQVFRDTAMLAPLKDATINLPNGVVIPNWMIDVALIAALPFFQTVLNILAPIITADHAPETLAQQQERQAREEAQAAHKAKLTALKAQGWGAAIGGGIKAAKQQVSGEDTAGYDDGKPTGSGDGNPVLSLVDTPGYQKARGKAASGKRAPDDLRDTQWTSKHLKRYAWEEYGVNVPDTDAQRAMSVLKTDKAGNSYVAPRRDVKAWVNANHTRWLRETEATGTGER